MVFFNRITGLWKTKESLYWGRSVCALREYENAQALVAETPLEPYISCQLSFICYCRKCPKGWERKCYLQCTSALEDKGLESFLSHLAPPVCGLGWPWAEECFCRTWSCTPTELCRCSGGKGEEGDTVHFPNSCESQWEALCPAAGLLSPKDNL